MSTNKTKDIIYGDDWVDHDRQAAAMDSVLIKPFSLLRVVERILQPGVYKSWLQTLERTGIMTAWLVIAIIMIWIFLSATLLVSLCMLSSRFNQSESNFPEDPISTIEPTRESWLSQEGTPSSTTYISMQ